MDGTARPPIAREERVALLAARDRVADLGRRAARAALDPVTLVGELEAIGAALDRLDGHLLRLDGHPGRAGEDVVLEIRPARPTVGRADRPAVPD